MENSKLYFEHESQRKTPKRETDRLGKMSHRKKEEHGK
jgi:hypothetical protein